LIGAAPSAGVTDGATARTERGSRIDFDWSKRIDYLHLPGP
jgi:hypothetical protein